MTWAAGTPAQVAAAKEAAPPRMWLRVYRRGPSGDCQEILPRTDVADTLDASVVTSPVSYPPCQCRLHRRPA